MQSIRRRQFLLSAAMPLAPLSADAAQAASGAVGRFKITEIRVVRLRTIKELGTLEPAWAPGSRMSFRQGGGSIIEVHTNQGLVGIGPGSDTGGGRGAGSQLNDRLVGQDPFDIDFSARGGSGMDIAIWDLLGKACGQPLYKLFRAAKEKVAAYASMVQLSTPEERAGQAQRFASEGWRATKVRIHHETMKEDIRTVEAVRTAIAGRMDLMVDANQAQSAGTWQPGILWDFRRAVDTARELERLGCYWLEEPLPRYHFDRLAELNRMLSMPLAGGENNRGLHEYLRMLQQEVYDILQPEVMVTGGITELRKIGVLADAFGRQVVPHHGGNALGILSHLHLIASWSHAPYLELLHDPPICNYHDHFSILQDPPVVDAQGYMALPQKPGLGVEINRDLVIKN